MKGDLESYALLRILSKIFSLLFRLLIEKSLVLIYNFMDVFVSSCLIAFDVSLKKVLFLIFGGKKWLIVLFLKLRLFWIRNFLF